jgi:drug/metabolite transporter (DMT)-like permease
LASISGTTARPGLYGLFLLVASAFSYALASVLGKHALTIGLPLWPLLATRFTLGAAVLWACVLSIEDLRRDALRVRGRRALGLVSWGVIGHSGQSALFYLALKRIPVSLTEVLLYTCPAFLALILWVMTRKRPNASRLTAIALALAGTWLCAGPIGGGIDSRGAALATLSGLWYAAFMIWMHRLTPGISGVVSGAFIISGVAATFSIFSAIDGGGFLVPRDLEVWSTVIGLTLSSAVFGLVLFVAGLKRVGPQTASVLSTFEPVGTLLLAAIFLGERLRGAQWAGAALIIGAAFVLASTADEEVALGPVDSPLPALPE